MIRRRVNTLNPVSRHELNDGLVAWFLAAPWLAGGPSWPDLAGNFNPTLAGTNTGGWQGSTGGAFGQYAFSGSSTTCFSISPGAVLSTASARICSLVSGSTPFSAANSGLTNTVWRITDGSGFFKFNYNGAANSTSAPYDNLWHTWTILNNASANTVTVVQDGKSVFSGAAVTSNATDVLMWGGTLVGFAATCQVDSVRYLTRTYSAAEAYAHHLQEIGGLPDLLNRRSSRLFANRAAAPSPRLLMLMGCGT